MNKEIYNFIKNNQGLTSVEIAHRLNNGLTDTDIRVYIKEWNEDYENEYIISKGGGYRIAMESDIAKLIHITNAKHKKLQKKVYHLEKRFNRMILKPNEDNIPSKEDYKKDLNYYSKKWI